jgi:Na+/H+ antiporter NhaD/arsenite permease-like protein
MSTINTVLDLHLTHAALGIFSLLVFVLAYALVMGEEFFDLRKSKPVVFAAGFIWLMVAIAAKATGQGLAAEMAVKQNILDYAELLLFLLVAMTYVNAMEERFVFDALRGWLVRKHFSYRSLFWITGTLAFFISPIADNMTTALIMCAIIMAVGQDQTKFIALSCINIVVGANAGGAFSPFGDITTLMVWQKNVLPFQQFFLLFIPAVVNFVVPAACMHFAIPKETPKIPEKIIKPSTGGISIAILFLLTITITVCMHHFYLMPPAIGMMMGLACLQFYGYYLRRKDKLSAADNTVPFDIFRNINRIEWDTLLFFYGVILCVGGLATFGYLDHASRVMYEQWGTVLSSAQQQTPANIVIGLLSAIVDNIPLMFAVITMNPTMSEGQWLLITLTAGVGGSLLSVGSAAGVALMGQAKGYYTFMSHLKWSWAILLGYFASIATHLWINKALFT